MSPANAPAAPAKPGPVGQPAPPDRKFPCQKCGARLDFDPGARALHCPYCGFVEKIEPAAKGATERDWNEFWQTHGREGPPPAGRSCQVACSSCGAVVLLDDKIATDRCPYCAAFLDNKPESAKGMVPVGALLPFSITDRQARDTFNQWIARRWFAPSGLRQFANLGRLAGAYVPFWTYDSMTYTHYSGMRGDDYTETETYTETGPNGQTETKTRTVTRTNWRPASGEVRHFFDDVLVYASRSLPAPLVDTLIPWELKRLEEFRPDFLSGFQTERYTVGLRDGFAKAQAFMDGQIRVLCCRDIGGDHQQLTSVQTQHVGITFKHILLPVWLAAYRYQDRSFQVMVNGRSGKVVGTRPYSYRKVVLLVLAIVLALLAVFFIVRAAHGETRGQGPGVSGQQTSSRSVRQEHRESVPRSGPLRPLAPLPFALCPFPSPRCLP